jgi:hypothetical protein
MAMPPRARLSLFLEMISAENTLIQSLPQEWIFPAAALRSFVIHYNNNGGHLHDWELLSLIANFIHRPNYATLLKMRHENQVMLRCCWLFFSSRHLAANYKGEHVLFVFMAHNCN